MRHMHYTSWGEGGQRTTVEETESQCTAECSLRDEITAALPAWLVAARFAWSWLPRPLPLVTLNHMKNKRDICTSRTGLTRMKY